MSEETEKSGNDSVVEDAEIVNETQTSDEPLEPRVFIAGLGQSGRELLYRLMSNGKVVGLDINEEKIKRAEENLKGENVRLFTRDGTSRMTWQDLGLAENDTVVAVTRRDDVNLEICGVAKENFGVKKLISLLHNSESSAEYDKAGVETVSRSQVISSFLETRVYRDRRTAMNIGLGQGEIMEVPILPGSSVIGRRLRTFRARPWLVGAIYRKDKLIVPHGNTVIKEGDRVLLIGEPHILSAIADFFKMGEPEFPLQYGLRIGVLSESKKSDDYEAIVGESNYLAKNSKATHMVLLSLPGSKEQDLETAEKICGGTGLICEPAFFPDEKYKSWPSQLQSQDFGCLVMTVHKFGIFKRLGMIKSLLLHVLEEADYPILISRGTHPYKKILLPVSTDSDISRVTQLAIDLTRLFDAQLEAVTVTEPAFSAGKETVEEQKAVLERLVEHSELYRMKVKMLHREGNPIQETATLSPDYSLMVLGYRKHDRGFLPRLDIAIEITARSKCSVMILPFEDTP